MFTNEQKELYDKLTSLQKVCVDIKLSNRATSNAGAYCSATGRHDLAANYASRLAHSVFNNPNVKSFLKSLEVETIDDMIMSREEILTDLSNIASTSLEDIVDMIHADDQMMNVESGEIYTGLQSLTIKRLDEIPEHARKSIKGVKQGRYGIEITLYDAVDARKQLAAMQGYNAANKTELTGAGGGPIQITDLSDDDLLAELAMLGLNDD